MIASLEIPMIFLLMNVWDEEEVNRFLKVAKEDPVYIVFYLALTTGMRQGELLGLR